MSTSSLIRCDHIKCLNEKWQPHFELKRWVWPMIKCPHLTPKSIYSNIGDLVADLYLDEVHMILEFFCFLSCSLIEFFFKQKKTSSRNLFHFYSYDFLYILLALINSPKIFHKFIANPLKHSSQSELNYFCISLELNSESPIWNFRSNRKGFGPTDPSNSVSPIYLPGHHLLQLHSDLNLKEGEDSNLNSNCFSMNVLICPVVILKDPTSFFPSSLTFLVCCPFRHLMSKGEKT